MFLIKLIPLTLFGAVLAQTLPPVKLGCAVFSSTSDSTPEGLIVTLGAGLPYTVFKTDNPDTVQLIDGDRGLYSCLITIDGSSVHDSQNLRNYQEEFGVRHIVMNSNVFGTASRTSSSSDSLSVPSNGDTDFLEGVVRRGNQWSQRKFKLNVFSKMPSGSTVTIVTDGAGAVAAFADNDTLHIANQLTDYDLASLALQHIGLQFLLTGTGTDIPLQGHRRVMANLQVDDFFNPPDNAQDVIITKDDLNWWLKWMDDFNDQHGSSIKQEICFNGLPLAGSADPEYFGHYDFGPHGVYSPAGSRKNMYTRLWKNEWWNDRSFWSPWLNGTGTVSEVAAELRESDSWKDGFFWLSHTMTHANMGEIGPGDCQVELQYNMAVGEEVLNLTNHPNWSRNSVITGMYSALENGDFYAAMDKLGMHTAISSNCESTDNWSVWSRNNYQPHFVDFKNNGYNNTEKNLWVVPRECTRMGWDAATIKKNLSYYPFDTIEELLEAEIDYQCPKIMALRHDPHMFHQANMVQTEYKGKTLTLTSMWIDYVLGTVSEFLAIPMESVGMNILSDLFHRRAGYWSCNPEIYVQRANGSSASPNYIEITTKQACSIAFEILDAVPNQTEGNKADVTKEGSYTWIQLASGGTVKFGTEVPVHVPTSSTTSTSTTSTAKPTTPTGGCLNKYTLSDSGSACWWDTSDRSCASCSRGGCQCGNSNEKEWGHVCVLCNDSAACATEYKKWQKCKGSEVVENEEPLQNSPYELSPTSPPTQPTTSTGSRYPMRPPPNRPAPTLSPGVCLNDFTTANTGTLCEDNASSTDCAQCIPGSCQCSGHGPSLQSGRVCVPCDRREELCPDYVHHFQSCRSIENIQ
eukprot:Clim_evm8s7 gene=Clim_evmTU8s7